MTKTFTKQMRENLDAFTDRNKQNSPYFPEVEEVFYDEELKTNVQQKKKTLKKNDGLIERIDKKIVISEDNRQFLRD